MPSNHRILIITTGGTIAGEVATDRRELNRITTGGEFLSVLDMAYPVVPGSQDSPASVGSAPS